MAHDVFISYSTHDKPIADAVCAGLEQNGIRCWIAPRDILAGMEWGHAIVKAIGSARVMVLLLSANANKSPQIPKEVDRAVNKGVTVIPLRIEDVQPAGALEYYLGPAHWLDAINPPLQAHISRLVETINALLKRSPTPPAAPSVPQQAGGTSVEAAAAEPAKPKVPPPMPSRPKPPPTPPKSVAAPQVSQHVVAPKPVDENIKIVLYIAAALVPLLGIIVYFIYNNSTFEGDRKMAKVILIIGIASLVLSLMVGCLCSLASQGGY